MDLKAIVDRIELLEGDRAGIVEDIKEVYIEAKAYGFDPKLLRRLIRERKRDVDTVAAEEAAMDGYRRELGMLADTPLGEAAMLRMKLPKKRKPSARLEYDAGHRAAMNGDPASSNPYVPTTVEREEWQQGWMAGWNERAGRSPKEDVATAQA